MKKFPILFFVAILFITDGVCNINFASTRHPSNRDVYIKVLVIGGGKPRPRPRSNQLLIVAELDLMTKQLIIEFNENMGRVNIQVLNSLGQAINSYSCNTDVDPIAILGITDNADSYSISIIGEEVEAYGNYEITE